VTYIFVAFYLRVLYFVEQIGMCRKL
jgi:hypothetical protein